MEKSILFQHLNHRHGLNPNHRHGLKPMPMVDVFYRFYSQGFKPLAIEAICNN